MAVISWACAGCAPVDILASVLKGRPVSANTSLRLFCKARERSSLMPWLMDFASCAPLARPKACLVDFRSAAAVALSFLVFLFLPIIYALFCELKADANIVMGMISTPFFVIARNNVTR